MYSTPRASRTSARCRSSSAWVTEQPAGDVLFDLILVPVGMACREVGGEALAGQLPRFVREAEPLHAGHGAQRAGDFGMDGFDSRHHVVESSSPSGLPRGGWAADARA